MTNISNVLFSPLQFMVLHLKVFKLSKTEKKILTFTPHFVCFNKESKSSIAKFADCLKVILH